MLHLACDEFQIISFGFVKYQNVSELLISRMLWGVGRGFSYAQVYIEFGFFLDLDGAVVCSLSMKEVMNPEIVVRFSPLLLVSHVKTIQAHPKVSLFKVFQFQSFPPSSLFFKPCPYSPHPALV